MATIGPFKLHSTAASAALTGTLTASATESDIVTGGKTLIITLTGATWVAAGATFDAIRQDIINGLDSAQAEATGWDALVVPALAVTDVVRTSDTVVTITLPAVATYDITADETITVTVPASATSATSAIVAAPTVTIATASGFLMVLTPSTLVSNTSLTVNVDFEVDWGDGVFVAYVANATATQTPTGNITVRAGAATGFTLLTNTISAIDIQSGPSISALQDFGFASGIGPYSNLTSFNFSGTNLVTSLDSADFFGGKFPGSLVSFTMDCSNVTSMVRAFRFCSSLTTLSIITSASLTTLTAAFSGCFALGAFPSIDTSGVTNAAAAWDACTALTSFPELDLSAATAINSAWNGCTGLTTFPLISLPSVQNASRAWRNCSSLTSFPVINLPAATDVSLAWNGCSGFTSFPVINVSAATAVNSAWFGCTGLTSFPVLVLTAATNVSSAWEGCTGLTTFPALSFPAATNVSSAWEGCTGLTTFPALSFPVATNLSRAWFGCTGLTTFPVLTIPAVTDMGSAFENCTGLETYPNQSFPACEQFDRMFFGCGNLVQVGQLGTASGINFTQMFPGAVSLRCVNAIDTTAAGAVKTNMFENRAIKHPTPDEIAQIIGASGLNYSNLSTGDCAPWVCSNQYISQYLDPDLSTEFGDKSMVISSVDTTGRADPLAEITLAHTDTVLDFSTGMVLLPGGDRYEKTVGNLVYTIAILGPTSSTYWVTAASSTLAAELGIFEVDQYACVSFV